MMFGNVITVDLYDLVIRNEKSLTGLKTSEDTKAGGTVVLEDLTYSGDQKFLYSPHLDVSGNITQHVYTIGETIYTPMKPIPIIEDNNMVSYIMTYCDPYNAGVQPSASPVNWAFWDYLGQGTSASSISLAGGVLPSTSEILAGYEEKLEKGEKLDESEINVISSIAKKDFSEEEYQKMQALFRAYGENDEIYKEEFRRTVTQVRKKHISVEVHINVDLELLYKLRIKIEKERGYIEQNVNPEKLSKDEIKDLKNMIKKYLTGSDKDDAWKIIIDYEERVKIKITCKVLVQIIDEIIEIIRSRATREDVPRGFSDIYEEAREFDAMWQEINAKYDGKYENSIKDLTEQDKVKVEYNADTKKYKVGPFKITYMKKEYGGKQFGGMTGTPTLTLKQNDQDVTLARGNKWKIVTYNLEEITYPNPEESFYVLLDFVEGYNAITAIKFNFKYVISHAEFTISEGKIEKLDWRFYHKDTGDYICSEGHLCDGAASDNNGVPVVSVEIRRSHESPDTHKHDDANSGNCYDYSCGGHTCDVNTSVANEETTCSNGKNITDHTQNTDGSYQNCTLTHEDNDENCNNRKCKTHTCKEGKVCKRHPDADGNPFFYTDHYFRFRIYSDVSVIDYEDIQDTATVQKASTSVQTVSWSIGGSAPSLELSWYIDLTTSMAGNVWEDLDAQKTNNVVTGTKDSEEAGSGIKNIGVTVKLYQGDKFIKDAIFHDSNGKKLSWPVYTDDNGYYEIKRLEAPGTDGSQNKLFYVVEFEYDGQVYKHTVYMADSSNVTDNTAKEGTSGKYKENPDTYKNCSMAVETVQNRYDFDQSFGEITGNSSIKKKSSPENTYSTEGITRTTDENGAYIQSKGNGAVQYRGESENKIVSDPNVSTQIIKSTLESPYTDKQNDNGRKPAKVTSEEKYKRYRMVASTYYDTGDTHGVNIKINDYRTQYPLTGDSWTYKMNKNKDDNKKYRYIDEYMLHINLGLQKRKETDVSLLKDLYKVTLVVNGQKLIKEFNPYAETSDYDNILFELERNRIGNQAYSLDLYRSDVGYRSVNMYKNAIQAVKDLKEGTELRVFATYVTRAYNNSETNEVEINEVTDYYDKTYTLVQNADITAPIVNENMKIKETVIAEKPYYRIVNTSSTLPWKATRAENIQNLVNGNIIWENSGDINDYHVAKTNSLTNIKLKNNEYAEIFTTYEVDQAGYNSVSNVANNYDSDGAISQRANLLQKKTTIAEISNYSTYYSKENDKANYYTGYNYSKGWISGRVDRDSAPNNIDRTSTSSMLNRNTHEDDTYQAKDLFIQIKEYDRDMAGYVWEDEKNEDEKNEDEEYSIKVGNGVYESGEPLIPNVKVSMYEVINLTGYNNKADFAGLEYYYRIPDDCYSNINSVGTEKNGTAVTENKKVLNIEKKQVDGNYYLYGFLAGDYVLRFDYGTESDEKSHENWDYSSEKLTEVDSIKYNGQDYENTRFLGQYIKNYHNHLNDKYLDLEQEMNGMSISKARDNESRRMVVDAYSRNIENERGEILRNRNAGNSEFVEATKMFAETPVMQIEIEDPKNVENNNSSVNTDKIEKKAYELKTYNISNINLGLEKRANTDIALEQYINKILLIKDNSVLFTAEMDEDGKVFTNSSNAKNLDKLTYMSHDTAKNQQGFYALNIENEFLNGLSLLIQYKIKVINNSEVDFTGFLAGQYTKDSIEKLASRTPTTALYDNIISSLEKEGNKDNPDSTGISSNATLNELLKNNQLKNALGLSEEDAEKQETDTIRPEVIIYGKYVGRFYYENRLHDKDNDNDRKYTIINYSKDTTSEPVTIQYAKDQVVKTTVDKLIDYIDVNTSLDEVENTNIENSSWTLTGITKHNRNVDFDKDGNDRDGEIQTLEDLDGLISDSTYTSIASINGGKTDLYDDKGRQFVTDTGSNIAISYNENIVKDENNKVKYKGNNSVSSYNNNLTTALTPKNYDSGNSERTIYVATRKNVSSDMEADEMLIDNLVEILVYSNPTGRRDVNSVPGNALVIGTKDGMWAAGYGAIEQLRSEDSGKLSESISIDEWWEKNKTNWRAYPENDAYTTEYVTVIPPTGIAMHEYIKTRIVPIVILTTAIIALSGVFIAKQKKLKQ